MHDVTLSDRQSITHTTRPLAHAWGIVLLLGMVALFTVYLWSARESPAVRPVDVVIGRPAGHEAGAAIEIVPYRDSLDTDCPAVPGARLCFVIGSEGATPAPRTIM